MSRVYILFLFIFSWISLDGFSATYIYSSIDNQLRDADATVSGVVTGHQFGKRPSGEIFTKYTMKLKKFSGINENSIYHSDNFSFVIPGGDWQGIRYQVSGAPTFDQGEEVFLILKKNGAEYTSLNLGLGKYSYKKIDGIDFLQSSVFPNHPDLGKISLSRLENKIEKRFGSIQQESPGRSTASVESEQEIEKSRAPTSIAEQESSSKLSMMWLMLLFVVLVVLKFALKLGR